MNPNRKIPAEKAREILADARAMGVRAIQFTGGGEPTVHPDCLYLFETAQLLGLETALVTNGYLLRPGWEESYRKMAWIRVSVDAGTPETYSRVRRVKPEAFERTLGNVRQIARAIEGTECVLGLGYVITLENWRELREAFRVFADLGVAYVRLAGLYSKEGTAYYQGKIPEIQAEIEAAKAEANGTRIADLFSLRTHELDQGSPDFEFCGYQQFTAYIGGDLKVYRCCTTSYTKHGEVGDLSGQRLSEWFESEQKRAAYAGFDARSCAVCQFDRQNRVINYLVQPAQHVEFV